MVNYDACSTMERTTSSSTAQVSESLETETSVDEFPLMQVIIVSIVTFFEPVQFGILFPFAYFMVKDFGISETEADIGYYVGILASSFCFAQLFTSLPWGYISDKYGRKPALIFGLFANSFTCLLFGVSKSYSFALVMRLLCGTFNGNMAIAKAVIGEITTPEQRGLAFAYWETSYGAGTIVGPMLGGLLVNPVLQYPSLFGNSILFTNYPYLLPCLVSAILSILGSGIGYLFLQESCPHLINNDPESASLLAENINENDIQPQKPAGFWSSLNPQIYITIFCYGVWCLINTLFEELYPLFAAAPWHLSGLQFTPFEIGLILSSSGIAQLLAQLIIYPILEKKYGLVNTYRIGAIIFTVVAFAMPLVRDINQSFFDKKLLYVVLFIELAGKTIASVIGYVPVIVFVNNSATSGNLGMVHGFAQIAASFVRALGPTLGGTLFSWSIGNSMGFPFDFHFTWWVLGIICVFSVYQSFMVEKYIKY